MPEPESLFDRSPNLSRGLLFGILALAIVLRLYDATRVPLWFDETYTLLIARLGLPGMLPALAADIHPPLHFVLVWLWRGLGGEREVWLRTLSVLFGVATVAVTWSLTRDTFGRSAALLAALLLALHRTHIHMSQEVRMYALLWLLYSIALWAALRWIERGRTRDAVLYVLAGVAAFYTHYQSILVLGTIGAWGVVALARQPARLLRWVGLNAAILVLFAPMLPTFVHQLARNRDAHWIKPPHPSDLNSLLRGMSFGAPYVIVPMIVLAVLPLFGARRRAASLLWTFIAVPVLVSYAVTMRGGHLFTVRYMFYTLPAWCALVATGVMGLPWKWARAVLAVGIIAIGVRSFAITDAYEEPRELKRAEAILRPSVAPGDYIFYADAHSLLYFVQYMPDLGRHRLLLRDPNLPYYEGAVVIPDSIRALPADFERLSAHGAHWWGVYSQHAGIDAGPTVALLRAHASSIRHVGRMVTLFEGPARLTAAP